MRVHPFDAFSGSTGLTADSEGIWLLTRKRGDADAYLMVDGKDIEEPQELALGWEWRDLQNAWDWLRHHECQLARHAHASKLITCHHQQEISRYKAILGLDDEGDAAHD